MPLDPSRTVAELRELRELTGDEDGAQRVAWTATWVRAKDWLGSKLDGLPLEYEVDPADFIAKGATKTYAYSYPLELANGEHDVQFCLTQPSGNLRMTRRQP